MGGECMYAKPNGEQCQRFRNLYQCSLCKEVRCDDYYGYADGGPYCIGSCLAQQKLAAQQQKYLQSVQRSIDGLNATLSNMHWADKEKPSLRHELKRAIQEALVPTLQKLFAKKRSKGKK